MGLLKSMISFIAGTILGYVGNALFGIPGAVIGSLGGMIFAWWAARKILPR